MNRYITTLGLLTVATLLSTSCTKQDPSKDTSKDLSQTDYVVYKSDLDAATSSKMDRVPSATAGHFTMFDEGGQVTDLGIPLSSFASAQHIHRSITTDEPGMVGGAGTTLSVDESGVVNVSWHPGSAYPDPVEGPWTKAVAFTDDLPGDYANVSNRAVNAAPEWHVHDSITTDRPGVLGSAGATMSVDRQGVVSVSWHPGTAFPNPEVPAWTKTVAFTDDVKALLVALVGGTIFEADHPYAVGDVVFCNDTLLKCTNACQEAEPTAGNWIRAKLSVQ